MEKELASHNETVGYGSYVLIWLCLLGLTILTVSTSGIDLGNYTLLVTMVIAATKSALVIAIFMHIKFENKIFKVFIALTLLVLITILVLTSFDFLYR
jgi:cytochrome c oxidase subunit IV